MYPILSFKQQNPVKPVGQFYQNRNRGKIVKYGAIVISLAGMDGALQGVSAVIQLQHD
jgi:hypothetical protein